MNRRRFLKRLGAGASLAVAGYPALGRSRQGDYPQDRPLGIALVGLGYYATQLLAPALQETSRVKLAGIVTGTPSKATEWMEKYDIARANVYDYATFDRIADNEAIDIVYVVLPNALHAEYVIRAAQAGKHVICEKPMALNATECEAMIQACRDAGVSLSIGYRMQFEPTTQEAMRLGQEKVLGPVTFVTAGAGYRESRAGHWKLQKAMGGGVMMDMGVYSLNAARYVTGEEPIRVSAQSHTTRPDLFTEVDEITTFQLEFPSGAVANLQTSFAGGMNLLHVDTERGWFRLQPFQAYRGIQGETSEGPLAFPVVNQQAAQMDDVARCIVENRPMRVPGEEGLADMRVVDAVYRSIAEEGRTIRL